MEATNLLIFDDERGQWGPMTDRRPVFELRTGARKNRHRIERVLGRPATALHVPQRLTTVYRERLGETARTSVNRKLTDGIWLLVNGRWGGVQHAEDVAQLKPGQSLIDSEGDMLAVCLDADAARSLLQAGDWNLPAGVSRNELPHRVLLNRPWHILDELPASLGADLLASELPQLDPHAHPGVHVIGDHPVRLGESARILPGTVLNAEAGPIVIDGHALLNPFTMIEGPCYVGWHTVLAAHTALRPNTVIGPYCKIGGEVSAAIVHANSNKAHSGYLGNSLVGEWCNLGADTNVSNLKNTYGQVRVQLSLDRKPENTGRMTHGPIVGDFVRTAIGTRLLTGSVVGTGCMIASSGYAPKCAAAFGFYTDAGEQPHDLDRLLDTVRRMLDRRKLTLSDAEAALLRHLHARSTAAVV